MKPKVYVETSVIGYLTSWPSGDLIIAARQKIAFDWWRDAPTRYELFVSDAVLREASTGQAQAVQDRVAALKGLPILPASQAAQDLADALVAKGAVPITEHDGAAHIAVAAVNGVEYLATWKLKRLGHPAAHLKINNACKSAGYVPPTVCSPEELTMADDPIVEEIRKVRRAHAEKFNNDIAAICEDIRRQEKESGHRHVIFPPRLIKPPDDASGRK